MTAAEAFDIALVAATKTVGPYCVAFVLMCSAGLIALAIAELFWRTVWFLAMAFCAVLAFIGRKPNET